MDGYRGNEDRLDLSSSTSLREAAFCIVAVIALVLIAFALEANFGIATDTTIRVACVGVCLFFIRGFAKDYPGQSWHQIGLWLSLVVDIAIFFTPLVDRPASRGELTLFALPDAIVVFSARIATYSVTDDHQRAMRQQMVLGLVVAIAFSAFAFVPFFVGAHRGTWGPHF